MKKISLAAIAMLAVLCWMRLALPFPGTMLIGDGGTAVTASLTASPASIASGSSSTLAWSSTNAASCISPGALGNTAIPSFTGAASGSVSSGTLTTTTIYSVQCGTATAAATVTVTGGGGGIACARGPNFTGTIPPPAAAAGFTTCVANYDFSQAPFNNVSNWLDCAGASNAYWFTNAVQCSDWSIVNDGGQTVLDQAYSVADSNVGTGGQTVSAAQTAPNGASSTPTNQLVFHNGHYSEATFMSMPDAYTACKQATCFIFDWWLYGYAGRVLEQDFDEVGTDGFATSALHAGGTNNTGTVISNFPGFNPKVYQTIGYRLTVDNTEAMAGCTYLNVSGNPIGSSDGLECKGLGSIPGTLAQGNYEITWVGSAINVSATVPINNNIDQHIKHILIFSCANWMNSSGCPNTPVLTTP